MGRKKKIKEEKNVKSEEVKEPKIEITETPKQIEQLAKPKKAVSDLMADLLKVSGNKEASNVGDEGTVGDVVEYTHTGCYLLNAQISGTVFGGLPNSNILTLAGQSSTGKTFFVISIIAEFLKNNPDGIVCIFDSENAINKSRLKARKVDINRVNYYPVGSLMEFQSQIIKVLDKLNTEYKVGSAKFLFVLDSLGNLPSEKEVTDAKKGEDVVDFTKTKRVRSIFRTVTVKLSKHKIPMIVTNHSYTNIMAYGAPQVMSGGGGIQFASDYILMLTKAKDKDKDGNITGAIVTSKAIKNRDAKENSWIKILISYSHGLHPYYGLLPYAVKAGIIKQITKENSEEKKKGTGADKLLEDSDGKKKKKSKKSYEFNGVVYKNEAELYRNSDVIFTRDTLEKIDKALAFNFNYGVYEGDDGFVVEEDEDEENESKDE